jgi:hypothetical protein
MLRSLYTLSSEVLRKKLAKAVKRDKHMVGFGVLGLSLAEEKIER